MSKCIAGSILAMVVLTSPQLLTAQNQPESSNKFDLESVLNARSLLRSGDAEVLITQVTKNEKEKQVCRLIFDFDRGYLRFDGFEGTDHWKFARNLAQSLIEVDDAGFMDAGPPDREMPALQMRPFDIRLIGMMSIGEFEYRNKYEDCQHFLRKVAKLAESEAEKDGTIRMRWDYLVGGKDKANETIWFDKNQGFSPTRMTVTVTVTNDRNIYVDTDTTTHWKSIGGVWVPTDCRIEMPGAQHWYELAFKWQSVNEPPNGSLFREPIIPLGSIDGADAK
jgi:hypothetical protein